MVENLHSAGRTQQASNECLLAYSATVVGCGSRLGTGKEGLLGVAGQNLEGGRAPSRPDAGQLGCGIDWEESGGGSCETGWIKDARKDGDGDAECPFWGEQREREITGAFCLSRADMCPSSSFLPWHRPAPLATPPKRCMRRGSNTKLRAVTRCPRIHNPQVRAPRVSSPTHVGSRAKAQYLRCKHSCFSWPFAL